MPTMSEHINSTSKVQAMSAAQAAETGRFQTSRVLTVAAGHAVHDTYAAFLAPLLPVFIENLSLSKTEAGLLTVFMQGPSLLQPFFGHLGDRVNLRYFVILGPVVTAVMMSLLGVAPSYAVLALFLMATGVSSAGFHAVVPVIAGNLSGRSLGRGMGLWMVGGELGRVLGPIVVVSTVKLLGLEGTPWLMIAGLLISALLYIRLRDVPGRPPNAHQAVPWRQALRKMGPLIAPLVGITAARSFMSAALTIYLPTFMSEEGADLWLAGVSLSVLEVAGMVGALVGGSMSDRLGRRVVLFISMLSTPLFMFVFMAVQGWVQFPVLLALGFTLLSVGPVTMALVQESVPENRAMANGVYMSLNFIIRSGAVVALGALGDLFGLRLAFTASAIVPLLGLFFIPLLPDKRAQRRLERESQAQADI